MKVQKGELQADLPDSLAALLIQHKGWEASGDEQPKAVAAEAAEEPETVEVEPETSAVDEARRNGKVLGNQSGLYHTPDSPYYSRTKAEEFFDTTEEAEAAGYLHWDKKVRGE